MDFQRRRWVPSSPTSPGELDHWRTSSRESRESGGGDPRRLVSGGGDGSWADLKIGTPRKRSENVRELIEDD